MSGFYAAAAVCAIQYILSMAHRVVTATIGSFTGYGIHFHVSLREPESGYERMMKFRRRDTAERWIRATFETDFDTTTDDLEMVESPKRWFYGEGD